MEGWPKSEATPSEDMLPRGGLNKDRHRLWSGQCQNFPGGKSGRLRPASALCGVFVSPPPQPSPSSPATLGAVMEVKEEPGTWWWLMEPTQGTNET